MCNNTAFAFGGAIDIYRNSDVTFKENCNINFANNSGTFGGSISINRNSLIEFTDNSLASFNHNHAGYGGAIFVALKSGIRFKGDLSSNITFKCNIANYGGALSSYLSSEITFKKKSFVEFKGNIGYTRGGAMYAVINSTAIFDDMCTINFVENIGVYGGALYVHTANIHFTGNSNVTFTKNKGVMEGGVMYITSINVSFNSHSNVNFSSNTANDYGGAVYIEFNGRLIINTTSIHFYNNKAAKTENTFYINVGQHCRNNCMTNYIEDMSNKSLQYTITTSSHRLVLHDPAICIDSKNDTKCDKYYINGIMFGEEIIINACVLDYYDQSTEASRLLDISSDDDNYHIHGNHVLISCNQTFQGIIVSNNTIPNLPYNTSINLTLHFDRQSDSNYISVNLIVELSSCHPGFVYNAVTHICKCYSASDVVYCSDSNSFIRRGYWFGYVSKKPTVTYCPINYCDFTCCETTNGFYHLSPKRKNQCALHRNGVACGSCEEGYTLSFDSTECVNKDKFSAGQKVLIIISTMLYWVIVVFVAFHLMHHQVTIGYLYVITYYYSVLDLLLCHSLYFSGGLFTVVSVMSSIAKLIPQFLGQLCLVENMDEIDQQFIHYIHPLAVSFILLMISLLAKCSYRVSSFISKDIIRVICLLILLSYTSVATTSLLMLQPLTFVDVDEVYVYLSPEIGYLHGRHLVYGLVAIFCTIVIVIGLPLLLLLEPFLNSKISFVKIKPLLDQFQGCYKDKYRCFSGYYMICRLIIIIIIIVDSSVDFSAHYILIIACAIMSLIHLIVKPYASNILNVFDGLILQLMIFIVSAFDFDEPYSTSSVGLAYTTVIMPMILFGVMELLVYRDKINYIFTAVICKSTSTVNANRADVFTNDIDLVIGDTLRRSRENTTCEM